MIQIRAGGLSPRPLPAYSRRAVNRLVRTVRAALLLLCMALAGLAPVTAAAKPQPKRADPGPLRLEPRSRRAEPRPRNFMVGIEGVGLQVPALRPRITTIDPRYLGRSVTLGGFGLFGRWQAAKIVGLEVGVRSGSLRYRNAADVISQDMVMGEAGVLLYLYRGNIGQLAIDTGGGALVHAIRYELAERPTGTQIVRAGLIRVGVDLEVRLRRLAFTASLRSYGVISDVARTHTRGPLFADVSEALRRAPVAVFQTHLFGSVGIAYRF
jgi:hypothetical protein